MRLLTKEELLKEPEDIIYSKFNHYTLKFKQKKANIRDTWQCINLELFCQRDLSNIEELTYIVYKLVDSGINKPYAMKFTVYTDLTDEQISGNEYYLVIDKNELKIAIF